MSDTGRQSMTDKITAAVKPDSQKPMTEKLGDQVKGAADSVASAVQPESQKSATQQAGDMASGNSNENQQSILDKAKHTLGMGEQHNSHK